MSTIKRLIDIAISLTAIILLVPVFLLIATAIRVSSKGSIIYTQKRVGFKGKIFTMYKFRSMKKNAENGIGPIWAEEDDPRSTVVGKWLRNSGIDELPQLINVLKGDMSLVGPRPERPFFVNKFIAEIPSYKKIFSTKPGITGWAQINWKYDDSLKGVAEKTRYDLYYIENKSLLLDLKILISTLIALTKPGNR